jgi:hypothetical protein
MSLNMNRSFFLICSVLLAELCTSFAQKTDYRNFGLAPFYPNANEIRLAETRARQYWEKNRARLGDKARYLAVKTTSVLPEEIVEPLWPYLLNVDTGATFLATLPSTQGFAQMECVMIFDTQKDSFVGKRGFLTVENPARGTLARYGDYIAYYIGTGRFL